MAILSITTDIVGQINVTPRLIRVLSTDTLDQVTATGYLNGAASMGIVILPTDLVEVTYENNNTNFFTVSIIGNNITLFILAFSGSVVTPTVTNDIAVFRSTTGIIGEATTTSTLPQSLVVTGNIKANAGSLFSYPGASGGLRITGVANTGGVDVIISNQPHAQTTAYAIPDVGQSTGSLMNCTVFSDPGANLIYFSASVTFTLLASGGTVTLYTPVTSSPTATYQVMQLYSNSGGTGFSGGGGNRNIQVSSGSSVYTIIPAANLNPVLNVSWGLSSALPLPSIAQNTPTTANVSLVAKYQGGSADYTDGSFTLSGILMKLTA